MFDRTSVTSRKIILGFASVGVAVVVAAASFFVFSTKAEVTSINMNAAKVAIRGYDTVAYFTDGEARKGKGEFEQVWQGARWHFVSATNRDLFAGNPDRYAPKYGGYCSLGLAMGEYSDTDPEMWTIVDGKLYLNKAKRIQDLWRKAPEAYIVASEANWNKHGDELRINKNLR